MSEPRARSFLTVLLACLVLGITAVLAALPAQAQVKRSISGSNLRFQIGGELQIPIATITSMGAPLPASCVPKGGIKGVNPIPGAIASTWATGRVRVPTSQFTLRGKFSNRSMGGKYNAKVIGVKNENPVALQEAFLSTFGVPILEGCGMTEVIPFTLNLPGAHRVGLQQQPPRIVSGAQETERFATTSLEQSSQGAAEPLLRLVEESVRIGRGHCRQVLE